MSKPPMSKRKNTLKKKLRVVELFAGVGGFRVGLESTSSRFKTVWFNQWEPGRSAGSQHAWRVYCRAFGENMEASRLKCTNTDIHEVDTSIIPDHDLLVGGFPCQDYSVARVLSQAAGLVGKKGVLWWDIYRIIREKGSKAPSYLMLENVDRLPKSPVAQRGRDFAVMLSSLSEQGYAVEWRVINAADYGMPQRRRRIYILGYRKGTKQYEAIRNSATQWLLKDGIMPKAFPIQTAGVDEISKIKLGVTEEVSRVFNRGGTKSPFENAGVMIGDSVYTMRVIPIEEAVKTLGSILIEESTVPNEYFITQSQVSAWKRLKNGKTEKRISKSGFEYSYSEGRMSFPDSLEKPSRTIVTGEGGSTPSRFKHVVKTPLGRLRRLTPSELERLSMFPQNHTAGVSDITRAFFIGNALVVGVVERLGKELIKRANL